MSNPKNLKLIPKSKKILIGSKMKSLPGNNRNKNKKMISKKARKRKNQSKSMNHSINNKLQNLPHNVILIKQKKQPHQVKQLSSAKLTNNYLNQPANSNNNRKHHP